MTDKLREVQDALLGDAACASLSNTLAYWRESADTLRAELEAAKAENARLREALEQALVYVENDEATHGRLFSTGNAIRKALEAPK